MRGDILLFLGLVAVIGGGVIAGAMFVWGGGGGGGSSPCDQPVLPRGESEISQMGFQAEDAGLTRVIDAASMGNLEEAEEAFSYAANGAVRDFTYDLDQPLREVDEELAKDLCEAVNRIEEELTVKERVDRVAIEARRIRELVRKAAEVLGYARPGE